MVFMRSEIPGHMPLNDMQIRCAKPEARAYTLGDGQGLSLCRYSMSPGIYHTT